MKNVLMPTDLTVQSLRAVHEIVRNAKGEEITVHVAHLISLPTSITDLLFINENKPYKDIPENFKVGLQLLRNKYQDNTINILFDFVYCSTSRYFNNFIEGNSIDEVYMLTNYNYRKTLPQSEDPIPYMKKCRVSLQKVSFNIEAFAENQNLSALLGGIKSPKKPENNTVKTTISYS